MKLIIIYGAPAVGKLTTANALSKNTGYPVLHNHMTIDLVTSYFSFNSKPFFRLLRKIRLDIIKELLTQNAPGLIWTTGLPDTPDNRAFYKKLDSLIKKNDGIIYYIKLICDPEEQKRRVLNEERKKYKKLDNVMALKKIMQDFDFSTVTPKDQTLVINNTHLSLQNTVSKITKFISAKKN